jgi:hypothetical protein
LQQSVSSEIVEIAPQEYKPEEIYFSRNVTSAKKAASTNMLAISSSESTDR